MSLLEEFSQGLEGKDISQLVHEARTERMNLPIPKLSPLTQSGQLISYILLNPVVKFYQLLMSLQMIEALYGEWHPDGLAVWLVVNGATEADRERIYEQEWALMQAFPGLGLDVRLLDRQETDLETAANLEQVDVFLRFPQFAHA